MQPLRDAIKNKYGVSDADANKVIAALAEVEKHRQNAAGSQPQGFRARQPGETSTPQPGPNIADIVGGSGGSSTSSRSSNVNIGGRGLIGVIISVLINLVMGFFSSRQQSQGGNVASIVTDILGGATHPSQAPDLTNILGNLLGGQGADVDDIANTMLGGQGSKGQLRGPSSSQR